MTQFQTHHFERTVRYLSLRSTQISSLKQYANLYTTNLYVLDIGNVPLAENVNKFALASLGQLKQLYMDNCSLIEIPSLLDLQNLKLINLSTNNIPTVYSRDFQGLSLLQRLDLSNNPITVIQEGAFNRLESLQYLSISNTRLTSLSESVLGANQELVNINLSGNKWNCNCDSVWLASWVNNNLKQCSLESGLKSTVRSKCCGRLRNLNKTSKCKNFTFWGAFFRKLF